MRARGLVCVPWEKMAEELGAPSHMAVTPPPSLGPSRRCPRARRLTAACLCGPGPAGLRLEPSVKQTMHHTCIWLGLGRRAPSLVSSYLQPHALLALSQHNQFPNSRWKDLLKKQIRPGESPVFDPQPASVTLGITRTRAGPSYLPCLPGTPSGPRPGPTRTSPGTPSGTSPGAALPLQAL